MENELTKKYPKLFEGYWDFSCGQGWYNIIEKLFDKISKYDNFTIAQIKEKWGVLRIYIDPIDPNKEIPEEVYGLIAECENESSNICEYCGKPGYARGTPRGEERTKEDSQWVWIKTRCDACQKEYMEGLSDS